MERSRGARRVRPGSGRGTCRRNEAANRQLRASCSRCSGLLADCRVLRCGISSCGWTAAQQLHADWQQTIIDWQPADAAGLPAATHGLSSTGVWPSRSRPADAHGPLQCWYGLPVPGWPGTPLRLISKNQKLPAGSVCLAGQLALSPGAAAKQAVLARLCRHGARCRAAPTTLQRGPASPARAQAT